MLAALNADYRFSVVQGVELALELLDAVAHVHSVHRYLHRDIKPANVFLDTEYEHLWLGDFGLAAEMDADGYTGAIQGTPLYTAPEGGSKDGRLGAAADIYSTGLTLFEILNGRFDYETLDYDRVDRRLLHHDRALPSSAFLFQPHVPRQLRTAIRRSIAQREADRYVSALGMGQALRRTLPCVDWRHVQGSGIEGMWEGSWPPLHDPEDRSRYRVESVLLRGGRRRAVALQRLPRSASFRRFGPLDATWTGDDVGEIEALFNSVAARAAHLRPAR